MTVFRWKDEGCDEEYANSFHGVWLKSEIESELIARGMATNPKIISINSTY